MLRVNTRVETQGDRTGGEERLNMYVCMCVCVYVCMYVYVYVYFHMYMYMYMMKSVLVLQAQTHGGGRPTGTIWIHWTLWWRLLPRHPVSPRPQHGLRITTRYPALDPGTITMEP
jgi:hypothetical protein